MYTIEMLPAKQGDCLWIEYGSKSNPNRILIDGGVVGTYNILKKKIKALPVNQRHFELIVVTHVDRDHIEGIIRLLNDESLKVDVDEFWYNGYMHIKDPKNTVLDIDESDVDDILGPLQGEYLSGLILKRGWKSNWNKSFGGKAVAYDENEDLPTITLPGKMEIVILSPSFEDLGKFLKQWESKLRGKFDPRDFKAALEDLVDRRDLQPDDDDDLLGEKIPDIDRLVRSAQKKDDSKANASSIAFIASFRGVSCLFAGDATWSGLEISIDKRLEETDKDKLDVNAMKISHHGGKKNTSETLLNLIDSEKYLISTDGSHYDHPDPETIARIIRFGGKEPIVVFNHRVPEKNLVWNNKRLMRGKNGKDRYKVRYPKKGVDGLKVVLKR